MSTPDLPWYMALIQGSTAIPKSIAKLLDTIGTQVGLFLEPTHIRRKGQVQSSVRIIEAKAEAEIAVIQSQGRLAVRQIEDRAAQRLRSKEARRQRNIEQITQQAA